MDYKNIPIGITKNNEIAFADIYVEPAIHILHVTMHYVIPFQITQKNVRDRIKSINENSDKSLPINKDYIKHIIDGNISELIDNSNYPKTVKIKNKTYAFENVYKDKDVWKYKDGCEAVPFPYIEDLLNICKKYNGKRIIGEENDIVEYTVEDEILTTWYEFEYYLRDCIGHIKEDVPMWVYRED